MAGVFGLALLMMLSSYRRMVPRVEDWEAALVGSSRDVDHPGGKAIPRPAGENTPLLAAQA